MVLLIGLEPTRPFSHQPLKLTRLPISPQEHMYQGFTTTIAGIRTQSGGRIELPFTLKAHQEPTSQLSFEQKEVIIVINIILLRNSDIYLLDWLDLWEEYTGETLGYLRLSLPHPILLSPPQLIGAAYSHYDYVWQ